MNFTKLPNEVKILLILNAIEEREKEQYNLIFKNSSSCFTSQLNPNFKQYYFSLDREFNISMETEECVDGKISLINKTGA